MTNMTSAEYLLARGWTMDNPPSGFWHDPTRPVVVVPWEGVSVKLGYLKDDAVTIQRARDAAEERAAWVSFASGIISASECNGSADAADAARMAKLLLDAYHDIFAVELVDDTMQPTGKRADAATVTP